MLMSVNMVYDWMSTNKNLIKEQMYHLKVTVSSGTLLQPVEDGKTWRTRTQSR